MKSYLLDTNVVSAFSPTRFPTPESIAWWIDLDAQRRLFLSVVSVQEISRGIALLNAKGAIAKAKAYARWIETLVDSFDEKIIGVDAVIADLAGRLEARAISAGFSVGSSDACIGATAAAHELVVVTYNVKHFIPFGVQVIAPDHLSVK